ncbi:hypothetical protein QGM71_02725 [Virgibacillus sp. C22-A2]|uniref:Uncharacterized protein n=1 Tax=Virgibacillus tibetensis TaxID=3042313 RepID=A0ABU6KD79_9BACI|nr:hypothetical protein [Virgibacillus sp. C22-A2]
MNKVEFDYYKRDVQLDQHFSKVQLEIVHVESEHSFVSPYQVVDNPKERVT